MSSSGPAGKLIVIGAAALIVGFISWQWFLSPKARVERWLGHAADAAEATDADLFFSFLSPDYRDDLGLNLDALKERLRQGFERVDRLNVTITSLDVTPDGDEMRAQFDLMVVAVRGEERFIVVGLPMQPQRVSVRISREDGEWKLLELVRQATTSRATPQRNLPERLTPDSPSRSSTSALSVSGASSRRTSLR